jgi:hypothetical protein
VREEKKKGKACTDRLGRIQTLQHIPHKYTMQILLLIDSFSSKDIPPQSGQENTFDQERHPFDSDIGDHCRLERDRERDRETERE